MNTIFKRIKFYTLVLIYKIKNLFKKTSIYHAKGTHLISGYMGSGKTLLMTQLILSVDPNKYFWISNLNEFKMENVYNVDVWSMFDNSEQVKKYPTIDAKGRKLYGIIFDEINLKFNKRLNKGKNYNNQFVGLIELIISSRHQGIDRLYFIGQKLDLQDNQLQSLFKYHHNILSKKSKANYLFYEKYNHIIFTPRKLLIDNQIKGENDIYYRFSLDKIYIDKITPLMYSTYGLHDKYCNLPSVYIKNYKDGTSIK